MDGDESANRNDPALDPFLLAATGEEAELALTGLVVSELQPVIERTLHAKLHVSLQPTDFNPVNQDALEISGTAKSQVLAELVKLRTNPNGRVIRDLSSYATGVTLNACRQYLRKTLSAPSKSEKPAPVSAHPSPAFRTVGKW